MKKDIKKPNPILSVLSLDVDPRFYLEDRLAAILPPDAQSTISTIRLIQKISASNLSNSDVIRILSLPSSIAQPKEAKDSSKTQINSQLPTPQLLMSPKKKKPLKEYALH